MQRTPLPRLHQTLNPGSSTSPPHAPKGRYLEASKLFPAESARKISTALRARSPGALLKASGRAALPQGQETETLDSLVASLKEIGLFIVEIGELERFVQAVGNKGPAWVNEVLRRYSGQLAG